MKKFSIYWRHFSTRRKYYGQKRNYPPSTNRTGKETASGFAEKEDRKTRPEAAELLERDFRKAKEKGYNPRELSQMLKNEGIIIPAYLIKRFFSEDENVSAPQKKETTPVKKHPTEKASFIVSDTSNENL